MRAALYARFSTDNQRPTSIVDQLVLCRRYAERLGADVVAEYSDAEISGFAIANRPGMLDLLAGAEAHAFDLVIAEHTDRLSRSGGGTWEVYDDLKALGIPIDTVNQGRISAMHAGMAGTMSAMLLEEGAKKTRRGLAGVAREGRHAGGRVYGYARVRELDAAGEPRRGILEIAPAEASVVVRIFELYAAGASPRAIAAQLNVEKVPAPRSPTWNASTINGNAKRGNGVLHNQLYAGQLVWGRSAWTKDRRTGARRARAGDAAEIVRTSAEHLRIVPEALWTAVQARYAGLARVQRPEEANRPRRLLSGLLRCGCCAGPMIYAGPGGRVMCSRRREKGESACANGRTARGADIEARVLAALDENLLHPVAIETLVREFHKAAATRGDADRRRRHQAERELEETKRRADRLVDQVADGHLSGAAVKGRLDGLEQDRARLEAALAAFAEAAQPVVLHPRIVEAYVGLVRDLQAGLAGEGTLQRRQAHEAFRRLVTAIVVTPLPERGQYELELQGDLAAFLERDNAPRDEPRGVVRLALGAGGRSQRDPSVRMPVRLRA